MTVYADVVFAVNTVINFLLLQLGAKLTGYPARPWKSLAGAVVGGGYAVCVLIPSLAFAGTFWGKCVCFVLMCMTAYGVKKRAARTGAAALLCGGALAGFVFLLTQIFSMGVVAFGGHIYYPVAARVLVLMSGVFYLAAAILAAGSLRHSASEVVQLTLRHGEKCVHVGALCDTGHTLNDPISGKPVIILEWQRGAELFHLPAERRLYLEATEGIQTFQERFPQMRLRLLPYRAVGTDGGLLLAAPCCMKIGRRRESMVVVALSPTPVSDGGGYEALIGGDFI